MRTMLANTSLFAIVACAKAHEGEGGAPSAPLAPVVEPVATVTTTIASVDVALPVRFKAGDVLDDNTAKIIDAAYRRQYANNKNAAYKAWEEKAKKWDEAKAQGKAEGERPANPCTVDALVTAYTSYQPDVGAAGQTSIEKLRDEAGMRRLREMLDEHNEVVGDGKSGAKGHFGTMPYKLPVGKGSAEAKAAIVAKILGSAKQAEHVQRHIDAILAEKKAEKDAPSEAKVLAVDELDI